MYMGGGTAAARLYYLNWTRPDQWESTFHGVPHQGMELSEWDGKCVQNGGDSGWSNTDSPALSGQNSPPVRIRTLNPKP